MDWEEAEARLESVAAGVFDRQTFRLLPRKAGQSVNHGQVPDWDREEFDFRGSIEFNPPGIASERRMGADPTGRGQMVFFEAVLTATTTGWPHMPRRGDMIAHGDDRYKIEGVDADGSARRAFQVNRAR